MISDRIANLRGRLKYASRLLLTVATVSILVACGGNRDSGAATRDRTVHTAEDSAGTDPGTGTSDASHFSGSAGESSLPAARFDPSEFAALRRIMDRGVLRVATVEFPGAYQILPGGRRSGFHYRLATTLGELLGVRVEFVVVPFDGLFTMNGSIPDDVVSDPTVAYEPDVFRQADLIAYDLTVIEWRTKLMEFVPLYPIRVVVVAHDSKEIRQIGDLQGLRAVIFENTSHERYVDDFQRRYGFEVDTLGVPFGADVFDIMRAGMADFSVRDSNTLMLFLRDNPDFDVRIPLTASEMNGWAVSKNQIGLARALEAFFQYARQTGVINDAWQETYGITMEDYLRLIDYERAVVLRLTPEEEAFVRDLRELGGLRIAIDQEKSIYEERENGRIEGLHYNLALAVGRALDLPVQFAPVTFSRFFEKDGEVPGQVFTDPDFTYQPDLLRQVDMYVGTFTPLEWRDKFLSFVPLYPAKLVYVTRQDNPQINTQNTTPQDLIGASLSLLVNTSYVSWVYENLPTDQMEIVEVETGDEAIRLVANGTVDVSLSDANLALARIREYPNITFFPADDSLDMLSWAVADENAVLLRIVNKVIDHLKTTRVFDTIWYEYYGIPFVEYLDLLSVER